MTNLEFMLEVIQRAKDSRMALCGVRKSRILAEAQVQMYDEEISCWEHVIRLEKESETLSLHAKLEKGAPNVSNQ
jgi:coenzyme F420-reducing hydrogenase alpha subunit